jgi:hypothetical protein
MRATLCSAHPVPGCCRKRALVWGRYQRLFTFSCHRTSTMQILLTPRTTVVSPSLKWMPLMQQYPLLPPSPTFTWRTSSMTLRHRRTTSQVALRRRRPSSLNWSGTQSQISSSTSYSHPSPMTVAGMYTPHRTMMQTHLITPA